MLAIQTENASKSYSGKPALDNFTLSVKMGTVFGLLGPNGAGKTTFVKLLLDLIHLDSGKIMLNGITHKNSDSRLGLSYLPEKFSFYPFYSVKNVLDFYAKMKVTERKLHSTEVTNAIKKLELEKIENQKLSTLSKGQLQRVGIASTLIGSPEILIFDEPFSGLDPIGIRDIKNVISDLKSQGKTIFINSHILSEIEIICDQIAILNEGKCLAQGDTKTLRGDNQLEDFFYKIVKG